VKGLLPLLVDLVGKRAAVFGAGPVGVRKSNYLVQEAEVAVIALHFTEGLDPKARTVKADAREVMDEWLDWADLVVAATDDHELNALLAAKASSGGKLFNRADGPSTFLIPSVVSREGYTVAISTHGRSPAMSRFLRLKLEKDLHERYDLMVRLQEELREEAREHLPSPRERERYLRSILDDEEVWRLLEVDHVKARELALSRMVD
jgi:precorrin-2 dehydrogenase/sirohydrochlorin ferrochelatase